MAEGRRQKLSLHTLTKELKDVRADWFQLGVYLKLRTSSLKNIEADYGRRVERCMTEMLELWLKDSSASWDKLVAALSSMDRRTLAQRLRVTYIVPSLTENIQQPLPGADRFLNPATEGARQSVAQYLEVSTENQNLQKEYMRFLLSVGDLLEKRKVSTDNLQFAWSIRTGNTLPPSSLNQAGSVQQLFQALTMQYHPKFFDYHAIADLAEQFGREDGIKLVKSYENTLKDQLGPRIKRNVITKASKLVIKVDWKKSPNRSEQEFAVSFRTTLSKLFRHRPEEYVLKSVRDGCLELTFLVPDAGIPHFKGVIGKSTDFLKQLCVMTLTVNEEILWEQPEHRSRHQVELENLPSPSKKLKIEFGAQVSTFEVGPASVMPSRGTDQRRHKPAPIRGPTRGAPYYDGVKKTYSNISKLLPALTGLVAITVGVILLVIAGVKQNSSSSMTLLLGSFFFLVVGFLCCSQVPRWRQHRRCRYLLCFLLVGIIFATVLYWYYQRAML